MHTVFLSVPLKRKKKHTHMLKITFLKVYNKYILVKYDLKCYDVVIWDLYFEMGCIVTALKKISSLSCSVFSDWNACSGNDWMNNLFHSAQNYLSSRRSRKLASNMNEKTFLIRQETSFHEDQHPHILAN